MRHVQLNQYIEPGDEVSLILAPGPFDQIMTHTVVRQLTHNRMAVLLPPDLNPMVYFPLDSVLSIAFPNIPTIGGVQVTNVQREAEPLLWLRLPDDILSYFHKRREHVRVAIRFPVMVHDTDAEGNPLKNPAESINISGGGMRLRYSAPIEKGKIIQLSFTPSRNGTPYQLSGAVVMCKHMPGTSLQYAYTIAVEFSHMRPAQKDKIIGMCFRYELDQKKHLR